MIERLNGPPGLLAVAGIAFFTELSFMRLIRLMAVDAERRRFPIGDRGLMATITARGSMRPFQDEIRKAVIEGLAVERHDISIASFMFGMAVLALRFDSVRPASVKTSLLLSVGRNVLVTVHAKLRL